MIDSNPPSIDPQSAKNKIDEIVQAANRLGVELDAQEALQWIVAVSAAERESPFMQDTKTGIFGNRISLLDFDAAELEYFRRLAQKVRVVQHPQVESAIAIAGSAAQGKVQLFPGDNDFFERVNIKAETIDAARQILRDVLRQTAMRAFVQSDIVLVEVNFGIYPQPVFERGVPRAAGDSITWTPHDVAAGFIQVEDEAHRPFEIRWNEAQAGLGWTYLGWIVADRDSNNIAQASNMMDVTWESPSGEIVALDGSIDPFFQEIYLEPESVPVFTKIVKHVDSGAMNAYITAMRWQAFHYTHEDPNFGKASKRLYNLFRLTDELEAAAYVRELFDEPGARMYQVPGLLEAADVALHADAQIDRETVVRQIDHVIRAVVEAAEGPLEADLVMELIRLRDVVIGRLPAGREWSQVMHDVRKRCSEMVSEYFRVRLLGLPRIAEYVEKLRGQ
ncbi:MAG: hypothetical protein HZB51_06060 [Chloroflexi bacterium]|nr:hypothetical protein [Chloroflexota bacterium]